MFSFPARISYTLHPTQSYGTCRYLHAVSALCRKARSCLEHLCSAGIVKPMLDWRGVVCGRTLRSRKAWPVCIVRSRILAQLSGGTAQHHVRASSTSKKRLSRCEYVRWEEKGDFPSNTPELKQSLSTRETSSPLVAASTRRAPPFLTAGSTREAIAWAGVQVPVESEHVQEWGGGDEGVLGSVGDPVRFIS